MSVVLKGEGYRIALEHAPNAMAITHPQDGHFLFANQAFCQFFDVSLHQIIETRAADLYAGAQDRQRIVQQLHKQQGIDRLPVEFKTGSGLLRWGELSARLVEIEGEQMIVSTILPAGAHAANGLQEKLASVEGELQQFAYIVSHDLQEPLRMVDGYMQLIRQRYSGKLDKDGDEFIGFAVDGANRLQQMINDLLVFSRVQTRGGAMTWVPAEDVLQNVLENLEMVIADAQAEIHVGPLPSVYADPAQLALLFQYLISNALKFHAEQAPVIHIRAEAKDGFHQFCVEDNGIGIDAAHLDQVFLIFRKLHSRERYPGTGMGLAISKRIVDRHAGAIWIESEPGQGSKVFFTIPVPSGEQK